MAPGEGRANEAIHVLLVEPNPGDARLVAESFAEVSPETTLRAVPDGETALEFVNQRGDRPANPRPDLVLLELNLPGTSGEDAVSALKAESALAGIPVVVLTSSDVEAEIVSSHDLDVDAYLRKPVDPEEFAEFVRSIEDVWRTAGES